MTAEERRRRELALVGAVLCGHSEPSVLEGVPFQDPAAKRLAELAAAVSRERLLEAAQSEGLGRWCTEALSEWKAASQNPGALERILQSLRFEPAHEEELRERVTRKDGEGRQHRSQADLVVALAADGNYFQDPLRTTYAAVPVGSHTETWPIRSQAFGLWLAGRFFEAHRKPVNREALADALRLLDYRARFEGECVEVYRRVAPDGQGGIYLDLCDREWRAVHVTPHGWEIVASPGVRFVRSPRMQPLPAPVRGGSLDELRALINVPDEDAWTLVKAWLIAALMPQGPYPVLVLRGEQGSAKSTLAKMLRALVDPAKPALQRPPRNEHELAIAAGNCWVVAFDNLSGMPDWLSDALCALATGGGFAARQLYTDSDEALFDAKRPVILNGITEFASRDDLLDRAISVELPSIDETRRRAEAALWADFDARHGALLGGLLDLLSGALCELPGVNLSRSPRMADFARVAVAAERAEVGQRWSESTSAFLRAYGAVRAQAHEQAIEASPIGPTLLTWVGGASLPWAGTATELLSELDGAAGERQTKARGWPKTAHHLSSALRRLAPALRHLGYLVEFSREGGDRRRTILITSGNSSPDNCCKTASAASTASAAGKTPDLSGTYSGRWLSRERPGSVWGASGERPLLDDPDAADTAADAGTHGASAPFPRNFNGLDDADAADAPLQGLSGLTATVATKYDADRSWEGCPQELPEEAAPCRRGPAARALELTAEVDDDVP